MKHLKGILRLSFGLLLLLASGSMKMRAQAPAEGHFEHPDSAVSLSLITCQPGEEAWSLYGHTAIHYVNRDKNIDVAVNYGMFNFHKPHFVLRFVFGLTDYEMGIQPYDYFCAAYAYERRGIIEQDISCLSPQDKDLIVKALEENYRPENREYRYNIFYDNCTTRARDILLKPYLGRDSIDFKRDDNGPSFRELTHQYTAGRPWAQLGNDLLLGVKADRPTTVSEQQFLPFNLMDDFDRATLSKKDSLGRAVSIVGEKRAVVPLFERGTPAKEFPLSPTACAAILALLIVVVTIIEHRLRRMFWGFDLALLLVVGLCGLVLTAMIFSQHPTVNLNLQIFLLNPLAIICLYSFVKREAKGRQHWFWKTYAACLVAFFAGNAVQCYAEGTNILALSLLFRSMERSITQRNKNVNSKPEIAK